MYQCFLGGKYGFWVWDGLHEAPEGLSGLGCCGEALDRTNGTSNSRGGAVSVTCMRVAGESGRAA